MSVGASQAICKRLAGMTLEAVESFGCDYAQGYYFSRPVPAAAFAAAVHLAEIEAGARAFPLAS